MKTEREFIDSVFSKYELEKARRLAIAKRNKTIYLCASFAACFCVVILGAVRILPALMGAKSAVEADGVFVTAGVAENYAVQNGSGVINYSADDGVKSKAYQYAMDEEKIFDACIEEAPEAPMMTTNDSVSATDIIYVQGESAEYENIKKAILEVVDCSFSEIEDGYTQVCIDGKSVGRIYSENWPEFSSINNDSPKLEDNQEYGVVSKGEDKYYVIQGDNETKFFIFLSDEVFDENKIEKIVKSVKK